MSWFSKTVEDIVAPLQNIVSNLEAHAEKVLSKVSFHKAEAKYHEIEATVHDEAAVRAKKIADKLSKLFD